MNKAAGVAYGVAAGVLLLLAAQEVENALLWLHDFSSNTGMFALGLAAAAFASFGPFALSLGVGILRGPFTSPGLCTCFSSHAPTRWFTLGPRY